MLNGVAERVCAAFIYDGAADAAAASIAVVSDRRLSVAALAALLQEDAPGSVLNVVSGLSEVKAALEEVRPQVAIADGTWARWPGISGSSWGGRVLLLLDPGADEEAFVQAVQARVDGYLSRTASRDALRAAVAGIRRDGQYVDPILEGKIRWALERTRLRPALAARLSERELEIVTALARGQSSKEVAREFSVTAKTVCNHVSNIYSKLNIKDRGQLVLFAVNEGLL